MAIKLTPEQQAAIDAQGKVIVSASAGSGKTFVMIERLTRYIMSGGDLDKVLAVTFTRKAAAQMKEKLRSKIIDKINDAATTEEERGHLKNQLAKIPTANISTIHSFCVYLLRTHFYKLDIDGSFDILSEDDGAERKLKKRAMDAVFDKFYNDGNNADFNLVLSCYTKRRNDSDLREKLLMAYSTIRIYDNYRDKLAHAGDFYTEDKFNELCTPYTQKRAEACRAIHKEFDRFMQTFSVSNPRHMAKFEEIYDNIVNYLTLAENAENFLDELPAFTPGDTPPVKATDRPASKQFSDLRARAKSAYTTKPKETKFADKQTELDCFYKSGDLAAAFGRLLLAFDDAYTAIKREEGKLDYSDLEHFTLKLLGMDDVKKEVSSAFERVFVDEYQDVNHVQEAIISAISGENVFLVGDVKQAIYGFRGSKSFLFTQKYGMYEEEEKAGGNAHALKLPDNFRSATPVIDGVNTLFTEIMTPALSGIDYKNDGVMKGGALYSTDNPGSSAVNLILYGAKDEDSEEEKKYPVYSVERESEAAAAPRSREGLAVVELVKSELGSKFFDIEEGREREVELKDICILTRKNNNDSVKGIIRELTRAGFPVSGNKGSDVLSTPECKQIIDILSYVDNGEQDVPMASAMLSPIGKFTENELAAIRLSDDDKKKPFRLVCENYKSTHSDLISQKLASFDAKIEEYRRLSDLFGAATLIDKILTDGAMEAVYMQGNGAKLKNVRRLAADAMTSYGEMSVCDFLDKLKMNGYTISLSQGGGDDSIKIMTMHASKGLEYPIVILANVCRKFSGGGGDVAPVPHDEEFGFVHKAYNAQTHVSREGILNNVYKEKNRAEDIKNEMNLLYVACTRAKYRLYVLAEEYQEFSLEKAAKAQTHANLINMDKLHIQDVYITLDDAAVAPMVRPDGVTDGKMLDRLRSHYQKPYAYAASINLPAKSSASAILRMQDDSQTEEALANELFTEEEQDKGISAESAAAGGTSIEVGTAYHRYLELCDFAVKDAAGISAQIESFVNKGDMEKAQADLLNVDNLEKILKMSVFDRVKGKALYHEQEFLCYLPANEIFNTTATDEVMVQGAIDLLCIGGGECAIIDYKYSYKGREEIVKTYAKQLDLYRRAVSKITKIPLEKISTTIVNIYILQEIPLI